MDHRGTGTIIQKEIRHITPVLPEENHIRRQPLLATFHKVIITTKLSLAMLTFQVAQRLLGLAV
jgi:hypothetical protein